MEKKVRSPGSATIINAIATGFGSAFGIGLDIECVAKTASEGISCSNDVGADNSLMEICVQKVFNHMHHTHHGQRIGCSRNCTRKLVKY